MCVEGGCGACIVAIQRRDPHTGITEVFAVNSVSTFIPVYHNTDGD